MTKLCFYRQLIVCRDCYPGEMGFTVTTLDVGGDTPQTVCQEKHMQDSMIEFAVREGSQAIMSVTMPDGSVEQKEFIGGQEHGVYQDSCFGQMRLTKMVVLEDE